MDTALILPVGAILVMIILYLSFKLWLAERDARLLREVRVDVGPRESGCLATLVLLVFLLAVPVVIVSRYLF